MKIIDPIEQSSLLTPGVYQIYCVIHGCSLFRESENMYEDFSNLCSELEQGSCENKDLQEDYQNFGDECFRLYVLDNSDEMEDPVKRKEKLEESIKSWTANAHVY